MQLNLLKISLAFAHFSRLFWKKCYPQIWQAYIPTVL